jgi:hypothetical protein
MASRLSIAALIFWLSTIPAFPQESDKTLPLSEYVAELDRLSTAVERSQNDPQSLGEIDKRLHSQWFVQVEGQRRRIPSEWLRTGFEEFKTQKSDAARRAFLARIAELRADAQAFQQPPQDVSSSRKTLAGILARREFKRVHGPTAWDEFREKLKELLYKMLRGIFGSSAVPIVSEILVWILVAVAIAVLAFWIFKIARQSAKIEAIPIESSFVAAKSWTVWIEEARAAAEKSSWRDAVHLTYWAGISFLESRGVWAPDKARTPREYLRLLASSSEYRSSLSALTRQFEAIWYGGAAADPNSFSEALSHLGGLGCPCN